VLEDLEAYDEATIELTVRLDADAQSVGVVELIFSISRQPDIRAHPR
jgi:acyl carrier protein